MASYDQISLPNALAARPRWQLPIIFLVAFASVLPVIFLRQIPFVDAPDHLARYFILDHTGMMILDLSRASSCRGQGSSPTGAPIWSSVA